MKIVFYSIFFLAPLLTPDPKESVDPAHLIDLAEEKTDFIRKAYFNSPDGGRYYGTWSGEIIFIGYDPYAHGYGTFKVVNPKNPNQWYRYVGNLKEGNMHGYGAYYEHHPNSSCLIEGEFKDGHLHGKCVVKTSSGSYIAGNFRYGKLYGKGALKASGTKLLKLDCNGLDLGRSMRTGVVLNDFPCTREYDSGGDLLIGAAMVISALAILSDNHTTIGDFLNCATQFGVSNVIKNPVYAGAASEAINSLYNNNKYSWANMSSNSIQNILSDELKSSGHTHLSNSISFLSYLQCLLEDSK